MIGLVRIGLLLALLGAFFMLDKVQHVFAGIGPWGAFGLLVLLTVPAVVYLDRM